MKNPEGDDDGKNGNRSELDRRKFAKILVAGVSGLTLGSFARAQSSCESSDCVDASPRVTAKPNLYPQDPGGNITPFPDLQRVDVVIVGAGLSGLIAARELKAAGKTVVVLEASGQIGGRMKGRATKTADSGYVDFGGQWVGPTQYHMLGLMTDLGIEKFDSYEDGRSIKSWNGTKQGFNGNVSQLLLGCAPPEAKHLPPLPARDRCGPPFGPPLDPKVYPLLDFKNCEHSDIDGAIWKELLEISAKVLPKCPWNTPGAVGTKEKPGYDEITFGTWLSEKTGKDTVTYRKWLSLLQSHIGGSGGFEPEQVSLLHMAWTQKVGPQADTPEQWLMVNGAGQIPKKLADDLIKGPQCRIVLNAPVSIIQIDKIDGSVNVFVGSKKQATVIARAVVIAIPPSLRAKIFFNPSLPKECTDFSKCSQMGSMSKVHAIYDSAFWRDDCLSGSTAGNLRNLKDAGDYPRYCEFIADSSPPGGKPGILTSFVAADRNQQLDDQLALVGGGGEKVQEWILEDFAYYFGPQAKKAKDFVYYPWDDVKGTCGAFTSHVGPNVWTKSGEVGWRKPVSGKIFWAGTEASDEWPGYFDGAVKAGKVAAKKICKTFGWKCERLNTIDATDCEPKKT